MPASRPRFFWGIKESYLGYVGMLPDARIEISRGAVRAEDGAFEFPLDAGAAGPDAVRRFRGSVVITGHDGLMHVELADPWVELDDEVVRISTSHRGERVTVATATPPSGDATRWTGPSGTRLTEAGSTWLGSAYGEGEEAASAGIR